MSEWVSVKDRFPENERVLAFTPSLLLSIKYRIIPECLKFKSVASDATHWMTLPQPPEKEE